MANADHNTRHPHDFPARSSERISFDESNWKFNQQRSEEPSNESHQRGVPRTTRSGWEAVPYRYRTKDKLPKRTS